MRLNYSGQALLDRMVLAVELVRQRLARAAAALEAAGIPYAVAGGNAVAVWVASIDPAAVRNTADVDIVLKRDSLDAAKRALEAAGFTYCKVAGVDMFLEDPDTKARDAVHIVIAGEKVRENYSTAAPDVAESEQTEKFRVLKLEALVRMKLTSFRRKDQVHLQDMLEVGLIDQSWVVRFPPELGARLQELIDSPDS